jgi:hypothetical protein
MARRRNALPPVSEAAFMAQVRRLASLRRWLCFRPYDSRRSPSGFPDLVLVRGPVLLYRELKTDRGRLTPGQRQWLRALILAGADAAIWTPKNWPEIEETLT